MSEYLIWYLSEQLNIFPYTVLRD